ncbi:hypothetical protein VTH82DRAFT_7472 [Thermothelomyces myriococcoides]
MVIGLSALPQGIPGEDAMPAKLSDANTRY